MWGKKPQASPPSLDPEADVCGNNGITPHSPLPVSTEERGRGSKYERKNVEFLPRPHLKAPLQVNTGLMQTHGKQSNTWCDSSRDWSTVNVQWALVQ